MTEVVLLLMVHQSFICTYNLNITDDFICQQRMMFWFLFKFFTNSSSTAVIMFLRCFFSDDQQGKWPSVDINDALLNHDIVLDTFFVAFLHSGIPCFMKGETECITTAKKPIV